MNKKGKLHYGWVVVIGCVLLSATTGLLLGLNSIFIKPVTQSLSISRSAFSATSTIYNCVVMVSVPFMPRLFKKKIFKPLLLIGAVSVAVVHLFYALAPSIYVMYLLFAVCGFASCLIGAVPTVILTSNWFVKSRGLATSIAFSGSGISTMIMSPVITAVIMSSGWRVGYLVIGACCLVLSLVSALFFIKVKPSDMGLAPYGAGEADAEKTEQKGFTCAQTLRTKSFWIFSVGILLSSLTAYGVIYHIVTFWTDLGHAAETAAVWFSISNGIGILSKALMGGVYDRFGVRKASAFCCALTLVSFVCLPLSKNAVFAVIAAVFFGLGAGIQISPPTAMTNALFGDLAYSSNYSIVTLIYFVGIAIGNLMSAMIFDKTGSYRPAWIIYAVMIVVTFVLWIVADHVAKKERKRILGE